MHSNPVLITFCSVLYYHDLNEQIYKRKHEKLENMSINVKQYKENRTKYSMINLSSTKKTYKRVPYNKWHLYLRLWLNKELIQYRKHNLIIKKMNVKQ